MRTIWRGLQVIGWAILFGGLGASFIGMAALAWAEYL